jgi:hypothetical protein
MWYALGLNPCLHIEKLVTDYFNCGMTLLVIITVLALPQEFSLVLDKV